MNLKKLFYTFLYWKELSLNTEEIAKYAYKLKEESNSSNRSNANGWQSKDICVFDESNVPLHDLVNKIASSMKEIGKEYSIKESVKIQNLWININGAKAYNKPHTHNNSYFSGVFYIKVPKNSGDLVFMHPNIYHELFVPQVEKLDEFSATKWKFPPEENLLVMFPAETLHYVETNITEEDRISIAFNIGKI